jgi:hypothetical protein
MSNPQHPKRAEDYDDDVQRAEDFGTHGTEDQLGRARPKRPDGGADTGLDQGEGSGTSSPEDDQGSRH